MEPLNIDIKKCGYEAMIGVGGIGTGMFFALNGLHTLGREESRSGHFLDRRDYCKLHIVSHYVKALVGLWFDVIPVGKTGDDEMGKGLLQEMEGAGLNMNYVEKSRGDQTLFSFCFVYHDGSGGNLTTDDSACSKVTPEYIQNAEKEFKVYRGKAIGLAVPEVPLDARFTLLELSTKYNMYRIASFTSNEIRELKDKGILSKIDLLALNIDEASMVTEIFKKAELSKNDREPENIVQATVNTITKINPSLEISITAGNRGNWTWDGKRLTYLPVPEVKVVSTAGAGDAFLAGLISGIIAGLKLSEAQELANLIGALAVTSPHTINKDINRKSIFNFLKKSNYPVCDAVKRLLITGTRSQK